MAPRHVEALCKELGYSPKRKVVSTRVGAFIGQTIVTLECRHDVERYKRPTLGSHTLCEVCARWEGSRQRAAIARQVDSAVGDPDNSTPSST